MTSIGDIRHGTETQRQLLRRGLHLEYATLGLVVRVGGKTYTTISTVPVSRLQLMKPVRFTCRLRFTRAG